MTLYAETSAVVAWLLDEESAGRARLAWSQLVAADAVHTSDLTLVECDRTLRRAVATGLISASESLRLHGIVERASAFWTLHGMDAEVVERSRRSFPCEPIRSLDALHLATALVVRNLSPEVQVFSFDDRIRDNANARARRGTGDYHAVATFRLTIVRFACPIRSNASNTRPIRSSMNAAEKWQPCKEIRWFSSLIPM